jgi:hypothetical protein
MIMKAVIASLSLLFLSHASLAEDAPQYVAANVKISGEMTADANVLLTVGKPAKVEWKGDPEGEPRYTLLIPATTLDNGVPRVIGILLAKYPGQPWTAIGEASSVDEDGGLVGLAAGSVTIHIQAHTTSKETFMETFSLYQ